MKTFKAEDAVLVINGEKIKGISVGDVTREHIGKYGLHPNAVYLSPKTNHSLPTDKKFSITVDGRTAPVELKRITDKDVPDGMAVVIFDGHYIGTWSISQ